MNQTPTRFFNRLLRPFRARNDMIGMLSFSRNDMPGIFCFPRNDKPGVFSVLRSNVRRILFAPHSDKCTRRARIENQIFRREKGKAFGAVLTNGENMENKGIILSTNVYF